MDKLMHFFQEGGAGAWIAGGVAIAIAAWLIVSLFKKGSGNC